MDTYFFTITTVAFILLLVVLVLGLLNYFGIKGFKEDNNKLPRIHIAISNVPVFACGLSIPLADFEENTLFSSMQILMFLLGLIVVTHMLFKNQHKVLAILFILLFLTLGYFMMKYSRGKWTGPIGLGSYSLLDVVLGLDLIRYLNQFELTRKLPDKNHLVLVLQTLFQVIAVACAKEKSNYTFIILSGIALFELGLLTVINTFLPKLKFEKQEE